MLKYREIKTPKRPGGIIILVAVCAILVGVLASRFFNLGERIFPSNNEAKQAAQGLQSLGKKQSAGEEQNSENTCLKEQKVDEKITCVFSKQLEVGNISESYNNMVKMTESLGGDCTPISAETIEEVYPNIEAAGIMIHIDESHMAELLKGIKDMGQVIDLMHVEISYTQEYQKIESKLQQLEKEKNNLIFKRKLLTEEKEHLESINTQIRELKQRKSSIDIELNTVTYKIYLIPGNKSENT